MKNFKIILAFMATALLIMAAVSGCGYIKSYPTSAVQSGSGNLVDNSTFPFEKYDGLGTDDGFGLGAVTDNIGFTSATISADVAYEGYYSLKLDCNFYHGPLPDANHGGGVLAITTPGTILAHKTLTAYVWVPANMFGASTPDGGSFFIQMAGTYNWYQGPGANGWQNLSTPSGSSPGLWNQISAKVDDMLLSGGSNTNTIAQNGENANNYYIWGFKVGLGSASQSFKGTIYIDSISIQ